MVCVVPRNKNSPTYSMLKTCRTSHRSYQLTLPAVMMDFRGIVIRVYALTNCQGVANMWTGVAHMYHGSIVFKFWARKWPHNTSHADGLCLISCNSEFTISLTYRHGEFLLTHLPSPSILFKGSINPHSTSFTYNQTLNKERETCLWMESISRVKTVERPGGRWR